MGQQDLRKNRVHQQRNQAALLHARSRSGASGGRFSVCSSWFDVRVLYARVVSCVVDEAPELLTMWFPPRGIDLALEVNGGRIAPSEDACIALRRDRLDVESEEVTFVSTDNIRTSGSLAFEIYHRHEFLVSGSLKQSVMPASGSRGGQSSSLCEGGMFSGMRKLGWRMECSSEAGSCKCSFVRVQSHHLRSLSSSSTSSSSSTLMEVCVVGRYIGSPVILTQTVQLNARRSRLRCAVLDVIPEDEECCSTATPTGSSRCFIAGGGSFGECFVTDQQQQHHHQQLGEKFADAAEASGASAAVTGEEKRDSSNDSNSGGGGRVVGDDSNGEEEQRRRRHRRRRRHGRRDDVDDDDNDDDEEDELRKLYESEAGVYEDGGEVSWFNAGVRVGVGIGLGMCLGVGLGVGLMVRTYNATARSFRRGIL